jgi:SH3 domain-containing protein
MDPTAKRTLFAMMVVVSLLTACASAPAATQDPKLVQLQQTVDSIVTAQNAQATKPQALLAAPTPTLESGPVVEIPDLPTDTPTDTLTPLPTFTPVPTMGYDIYCEPLLEATQTPQLESQLEVAKAERKTVIIQKSVNLRTQPSRLNRIILVLKPGTQVKIIDGPVETQYAIGKYVWWKVELPGGLTGWSAELSVCGRYYFLDPSTATATASQ